MVAINQAFSVLVYRYATDHCRGLPIDGNIWNSFPFNNERFCSLAGIQVGQGLSQPPGGSIGAKITRAALKRWPDMAKQATEYLEYCDNERRQYGNKVTIEEFQRVVLKNAPTRKAWEWLMDTLWNLPGGIGDKLVALGRDLGCDAEEAYRADREEKMAINGPDFREDQVVGTKFDAVFLPARPALARAVFGDPEGTGRQLAIGFPTLRAMMFRHFYKRARGLKSKALGIGALEDRVKNAYEAANNRPTLTNLRKAISEYESLISVQRAIGITGTYEENGPWRKRLDELMANLGRKKRDGKTVKGGGKHPMINLVSEEELDHIWQQYRAAIWVPAPPGDIVDDEDEGDALTDAPLKGLNDFSLDAGVKRWAKVSLPEIKKMLLIPETGLPGTRLEADGTPTRTGLWHQYVGALEMVNRSFTAGEGDPGDPSLIADEVGMGKTGQSILFFQILWHLKWLQDSNAEWPNIEQGEDRIRKWPEFLGKRTFFMGHERIPALPSVIIAPPTLLTMWRAEVATWLSDSACNTLVYKGTIQQRRAFFESDGPYDRALHSKFPEHTIVFVEASAVLAEGRAELTKLGDRRAGEPCSGNAQSLARTIFSKDFLLAILEEGHIYRNGGQNYATMCTLMARASQRMLLTATPVFTHPRDLLNLGRLLQALPFIGASGIELTKRVTKMFKTNQGNWDTEEEQQKLREFLLALRGYDPSASEESEAANTSQINELPPEQLENIDSYKAFWGTREGLFELRRIMKPYIIRRDKRSVDADGQPLLGLLPLVEVTSYLTLNEPTINALKSKTDGKLTREQARLDLSGFFTSLKKILVHPWLLKAKPKDKSTETYMKELFPDLETYRNNPSLKIDRLIRILRHHIGNKNARNGPLLWNKDGTEMEGTVPLVHLGDNNSDPQNQKLVIYCHLSESWSLVDRILSLHGFKSILVNGLMTTDERDHAVRDFQSEGGPDILFLSDVGAQGLNLQRGSIMVFMDHPWSASECQQIVGRLQRRGQTKQVTVYSLVAENTPDQWLKGYASSKKLMMDIMAYVYETETLPGFEHIHKDESSLGEEDEEDLPKRGSRVAKSKAPVRRLKASDSTARLDSQGQEKAHEDEGQDDKIAPTHSDNGSVAEVGPSKPRPSARKKSGSEKAPITSVVKASTNPLSRKRQDTQASKQKEDSRLKAPAPKTPHPEPEIHPTLGRVPKEGTRARIAFDRRLHKLETQQALIANQMASDIRAEVEATVHAKIMNQIGEKAKALQEAQQQEQAARESAVLGDPTGDSDTVPALAKGKEKEREVATIAPPALFPSLTALQTQILSKIIENGLSIEQAQIFLATVNEPPLPPDVLPGWSAPGSSGTNSVNNSEADSTAVVPVPSVAAPPKPRPKMKPPPHSTLQTDPATEVRVGTPSHPSPIAPSAGCVRPMLSPPAEQQVAKRPRKASGDATADVTLDATGDLTFENPAAASTPRHSSVGNQWEPRDSSDTQGGVSSLPPSSPPPNTTTDSVAIASQMQALSDSGEFEDPIVDVETISPASSPPRITSLSEAPPNNGGDRTREEIFIEDSDMSLEILPSNQEQGKKRPLSTSTSQLTNARKKTPADVARSVNAPSGSSKGKSEDSVFATRMRQGGQKPSAPPFGQSSGTGRSLTREPSVTPTASGSASKSTTAARREDVSFQSSPSAAKSLFASLKTARLTRAASQGVPKPKNGSK